MADDLETDADEGGFSAEQAHSAFLNILKAQPAGDDAPEAPEEKPEIQAQPAETQQASDTAPNTDEVVQAPASETATETMPAPEKPQPQQAAQPTAPAEDQEAKAAREQVQNALTFAKAFIPQLHAQIMGEFSDIKTQDDLVRVGMTDPDRYNRFVLSQMKMQNIMGQYQELDKQAKAAQEASGPKVDWAAEQQKLNKAIPDLADPVKGPALEKRLVEYAKEKGISPAGKTAAEIATLYESMQLRDIKAEQAKALAEANKKAAKAPPVQTPGNAKPQNTKQDKAQEAFSRLQKTGRDADATDVFRSILSH